MEISNYYKLRLALKKKNWFNSKPQIEALWV